MSSGDSTVLGVLGKIVLGAAAGVATITALPVMGAVGAITATGVAVGSAVGGTLAGGEELARHLDD